jgi:hypothetical protein
MMLIGRESVNKGDTIRLNDRATDWARDGVFKVSEVRHWGVVCWQRQPAGCWAPYHAPWNQIAEVIEVQHADPA